MSGQIIFPNSPPVPISRQPDGNYAWVDKNKDAMTQFEQPMKVFGTTAFMAHNTGAGRYMQNLKVGDNLTYAERMGSNSSLSDLFTKTLKVKEIHRFQALRPRDPQSDFVDLDSGSKHTAEELSRLMYGNKNKTVFQTCIAKNGKDSWGRMFVITE